MKSVAFDHNVPVFISPDVLISGGIETDDECEALIANLQGIHKNAVAFLFRHDGFRIYFLVLDSFVVLKRYHLEHPTAANMKKYGLRSVRFDSYTHQWSEKEFYDYKRTNKPQRIVRSFGYFTATYKYDFDKTYVSEIKVTDDSLYLIDMKFRRKGTEIGFDTISKDYPEIVSGLRRRIPSIENLTNRSKVIKSYLSVIDMLLI